MITASGDELRFHRGAHRSTDNDEKEVDDSNIEPEKGEMRPNSGSAAAPQTGDRDGDRQAGAI